MSDGQATTISDARTVIDATESVRVIFARSTFEAFRTQEHPNATNPTSAFILFALAQPPAALNRTVLLISTVYPGPISPGTDVDERFSYGNPYPPSWPLFAQSSTFRVSY